MLLEDKIIKFQDGIPGFEDEKEFVILYNEDQENPFHYLQSVKNEFNFIITDPFEIFEDYEIEIPETALEKLKIKEKEDVLIFAMVSIPKEVEKMTANLAGPVVINIKEKLGKQIILDDNRYTTRHYIVSQKESD